MHNFSNSQGILLAISKTFNSLTALSHTYQYWLTIDCVSIVRNLSKLSVSEKKTSNKKRWELLCFFEWNESHSNFPYTFALHTIYINKLWYFIMRGGANVDARSAAVLFVFFVIILYVSPGRSVIEQRVPYLGHSQIIRRDVRVHFAPLSVCAHMLKYGHKTLSVLTRPLHAHSYSHSHF